MMQVRPVPVEMDGFVLKDFNNINRAQLINAMGFTHTYTPTVSQQHSSMNDSGYYTSFTPSTLDAGELTNNENVDPNENNIYLPTTPLKRNCKSSCKLSPYTVNRGNYEKLDFTIHSLSCESESLLPKRKRPGIKVTRAILYPPDRKVDIIKNLIEKDIIPPLKKIISYLPTSDVANFAKVSSAWSKVFDFVSKNKRNEIIDYLKRIEQNKENQKNNVTENLEADHKRKLKDITNVEKTAITNVEKTAIGITLSEKFKKYLKSASISPDVKHLPCVRCSDPARVYDDLQWAKCTEISCSFEFCKLCKYEKRFHTDKKCSQYGLDSPSPSKSIPFSFACSKESKRKLRRLL